MTSTMYGIVLMLLACSNEPTSSQVITTNTVQTATVDECVPRDEAPLMPSKASDYAALCSKLLGQIPTADCGEGVRIPIYVDGVEVFETPADNQCDNAGFKGACDPGSTLRRQEGVSLTGDPRPEVQWVTFCRALDPTWGTGGLGSVQMIGHDTQTGATCFFESPDSIGSNAQEQWVAMNADGILDGQLPGPNDPDYDTAWVTAGDGPCSECHHNDPFIHNPWIDGARLPEDPSQSVLPEIATADSPYWVVGGPYWDLRTPHIEGNTCVGCHRVGSGTIDAFEMLFDYGGGIYVNDFMPPYAPGTEVDDFEALKACWKNGPENTPDCEWVSPVGAYCDDGLH